MPEPKRKDEGGAREKPAGPEPGEKQDQPHEEYTDYRENEGAGAEDPEAEREAGLQPGRTNGDRPRREE